MFIIKKDIFQSLKHPISEKLFGTNKTWRGFVVVSLINAFVLYIINLTFGFKLSNALFLGCILGLAYMFFELPNSFMKRKLGIQSGAQAASNTIVFTLIDKMDSAFGVNLVYFLIGFVNYQYALLLFVFSSCTHILISQVLVRLNIKKSF